MTDPADASSPPADPAPAMRTVLSGALAALFVGSLTNTIVGIALPTIAGELGGQDQVPWVASAALLTMTVATPLWGKAADRKGPRPLLLAALGVFVAGSLVAGCAPEMSVLIAGRALQGVGAGGVLALTNALVAGLVPARRRGLYTGWFGVAFGTASVAGPLVGGLLVGLPGLGWRWCFLGVIPVALAAALLVRLAPHRVPDAPRGGVDVLGGALLAACASTLVLLLSAGGRAWPWPSWPTAALGGAVLVLAAGCVHRERRAADPILPPSLFARPGLAVACATSFLVGAVMFGGVIYLPQYLQVVRGHGATGAGLLMLPQVGTMIAASTLSGYLINRTGRWKVFPVVGCALVTAGAVLLSPLAPDTSAWWLAGAMAVLGLGTGLTQQVLVLVAQNAVGAGDVGVAGAAATFSRTLGGAVGVAAFGAMISARLRSGLPSGQDPDTLLGTPERVAELPAQLADSVRTSYTAGLASVFLVAVPLAAAALAAVTLTRETPLDTRR
ncbi:MFS transporter [Streptomyces olivaceus]|uniref:MFS transporter n=1 Tax=Streptomyces olivaceus TaxID=47716 RepID=UPI001CCB5824|nr:MFS transporter [Streptomyces olivaceus]MBZ6202735.1 MFS transporter [Streptomyces olivaceus]MBZ6293202.1 MFS transporter [Streptomyces olivaceus]MBZ6328584.1 MFS transporter [Streptomyces olivaceus]